MYYYRFLHPNLKYYGVVNMKQDISIPVQEIFPLNHTNPPISLDYFLIINLIQHQS